MRIQDQGPIGERSGSGSRDVDSLDPSVIRWFHFSKENSELRGFCRFALEPENLGGAGNGAMLDNEEIKKGGLHQE